jgi:ketosteroid isomerase-like protein
MQKRVLTLLTLVLAFSLSSFAAPKKAAAKTAAGPIPDKAYLQKIWDGWGTLDASKVAEFYASGDHTFFDIAPLKYNSWDEYQKGVTNVIADYKSATFTLNDDAQLHPAGDYVWGTATVKSDMTHKSGKRDMATFRWTFVFEKQDGKWLIVHEHISEPLQ